MRQGYFKVVWTPDPKNHLVRGDERPRPAGRFRRVCTKIARTKEIARAIQACIPGSRIVSWIDGVLSVVR